LKCSASKFPDAIRVRATFPQRLAPQGFHVMAIEAQLRKQSGERGESSELRNPRTDFSIRQRG
jgi:hypothetical protein